MDMKASGRLNACDMSCSDSEFMEMTEQFPDSEQEMENRQIIKRNPGILQLEKSRGFL